MRNLVVYFPSFFFLVTLGFRTRVVISVNWSSVLCVFCVESLVIALYDTS